MRVQRMLLAGVFGFGLAGAALGQAAPPSTSQPAFVVPKTTTPLTGTTYQQLLASSNLQPAKKLDSDTLKALYGLQLVKQKMPTKLAENKSCFKIRSYNFSSGQPISESPTLTGETTCTPASAGRVKKLTVTPTPAPAPAN